MAGSIICGADTSQPARAAEQVARGLSAQLGLPLVFVYVVGETGHPDAISAAEDHLKRLTATDGPETNSSWKVDVGHPADCLVELAEQEEASLIIVGSHGSRVSLLGSISADVSRRAPCPVVVVPPGAAATIADRTTARVSGGIARFDLGSPSRDDQ